MEPVLAEEKREQAENLIKDGYYADAISALEMLARDRSPSAGEHAKWARKQIPNVKSRLKKARRECQDACGLAEQLLDEGDYAGSVDVLERFKRGSRSAHAEDILAEAQRYLKKVTKLTEKVDRLKYERQTETDEFFFLVEELVELDPKNRPARQLYRKLKDKRKEEHSWVWRLGLGLLGLACLFGVYWVVKLATSRDTEGTIEIAMKEPGLEVSIDGELVPSADYGTKLDRYEEGTHRLVATRDGVTIEDYNFEVEKNLHKVISVPRPKKTEETDGSEMDDPGIANPLPTDPIDPLDAEPPPLVQNNPPDDPMNTDNNPDSEPKPEPPKKTDINGFPIAEQSNYVRLAGAAIAPKYAVFSPDTTRVAAEQLTSDPIDERKTYTLNVWDSLSGQPIRQFPADLGELQGMAFSQDGKSLAAAFAASPDADKGTVQIWSLENGSVTQSIPLAIAPGQQKVKVNDLAFSKDDTRIGAVNQNAVRAWRVSDGEMIFEKSLAPADVISVGFFPQGDILIASTATAGGSEGVMSINMQNGAQLGYLDAGRATNPNPVFTVSPDLSVMTVLNENSIRRYAIQNGRYLSGASLPTFLGQDKIFTRVNYSPSGVYAMATGLGRRPLIWRDSDFDRKAILGETAFVGAYAAAFAPDSTTILQLDRPDNTDLQGAAAVIRTWKFKP